MTTTKTTTARKTRATKTRATKTRATKTQNNKPVALDMAQFDGVLAAYNEADTKEAGARDVFNSAKAQREAQLIAFVDTFRAIFGQDRKDFAPIRNGRGKDKGEYCDAFRARVAAFYLSPEDQAVLADPAQKWTRTNDAGKREFGPAWAVEKIVTSWVSRLLGDALPILAGDVKVTEDADGNKAKAKRGARTTAPLETRMQKKMAEIISAIAKDKTKTKPEVTAHDAILKDAKALAALMAKSWK